MEYEYRAVQIPAHVDRDAAREMLQIHAEYGDWELSGHRIYPGGKRSITVRRRVRGDYGPPLPS